VNSNNSRVYYSCSNGKLKALEPPNKLVLSVSFVTQKEALHSLHYFVKPKELDLSKPAIKLRYISNNSIEVTSNKLAKNVYLNSENEQVLFEDNYFDLLPNEKKIVKLSGKQPHNSKPKIEMKSLFDICY
jgi:beta-mannosidase